MICDYIGLLFRSVVIVRYLSIVDMASQVGYPRYGTCFQFYLDRSITSKEGFYDPRRVHNRSFRASATYWKQLRGVLGIPTAGHLLAVHGV
jgi:hypothetical protein